MKDQGFLKKCCHGLAKEFRIENFKLNHVPVDDFYTSQWETDSRSFFFLMYRWFVALFFVGVVFTCMIYQWAGGKFFIFLTDWGFIMCMITSIYGAILVTKNYFSAFDSTAQTVTFKVYWVFHTTTLVTAVIITIVYWIFLWDKDTEARKNTRSLALNAFQHACNTAVMLFDQFIVAFPTKLLHFIYPLSFGLLYAVFSFIYYEVGGTGPLGTPYIYYILDWSNPGSASTTVVGVALMIIIAMSMNFCAYKLRRLIYESMYYEEVDLPK